VASNWDIHNTMKRNVNVAKKSRNEDGHGLGKISEKEDSYMRVLAMMPE